MEAGGYRDLLPSWSGQMAQPAVMLATPTTRQCPWVPPTHWVLGDTAVLKAHCQVDASGVGAASQPAPLKFQRPLLPPQRGQQPGGGAREAATEIQPRHRRQTSASSLFPALQRSEVHTTAALQNIICHTDVYTQPKKANIQGTIPFKGREGKGQV